MANTDFKCSVCQEQISESPVGVRIVHRSWVCSGCVQNAIMPLFRGALVHEHHYPPTWGSKVIEYNDFKDFLTSAEQAEWEIKIEEYNTSVPTRIYCKHKLQGSTANDGTVTPAEDCNNFMGSTTLQGGVSSCSKCQGWSCRLCGGVYEVPEDTETDDDSVEIEHICKEKESDVLQDPELEDHYQRCPNPTCGFIVELESGCNAMDCDRCGTIFCYLCGEVTEHESDHWTQAAGSTCPRYNKLGDAHAQFDDDPVPVPELPADDPIVPDRPIPDPLAFRDPLGPLRRAPHDQVLDAFRVARDQIRGFDVEDNGQQARHPPISDYAFLHELGSITHDFMRELEDTFGSVEDALEPLRVFYQLLIHLDANIRYIRMVEERHEIFFPAYAWPTERFDRADAVSWYEAVHQRLAADFMEAFFDAMEHAVVGSSIVSFNPNTEDDLRLREILGIYLAWDMAEYRAGAVDVQLHHQRCVFREQEEQGIEDGWVEI